MLPPIIYNLGRFVLHLVQNNSVRIVVDVNFAVLVFIVVVVVVLR